MSAPVRVERTKRLLSTRSPPSLHPCLLPSLPPHCRFYELPWALIHLCHTQAPLLGLLTNWLGCRWEGPAGHVYGFCSLDKDLRVRPQKNMWSSGCGQANVFSMCAKNTQVNTVWEYSCTSCCSGCVTVWASCSLGKYLNWFGYWELKAVHLNMKDMIIQWPSGLLVSSDWINNGRNLKTHMGRFGNRVKKEAKV